MKKEELQFLINKTTLNQHYNRDFIEIMSVEPGEIFVFFERAGEKSSRIEFATGDLRIVIRTSADNKILTTANVNEQGATGNYWFKQIPVGREIFAELFFESQTQLIILAVSTTVMTLGNAVPSTSTGFNLKKKDDVKTLNLDEHIPYNNLYKRQ